jgi:NAD(P)H-flavin reductase
LDERDLSGYAEGVNKDTLVAEVPTEAAAPPSSPLVLYQDVNRDIRRFDAAVSAASLSSRLVRRQDINRDIFRLDFAWAGPTPRPGQFFLIKPEPSAVFLGRPLSVAGWAGGRVTFLIARRGRGTEELAALHIGKKAALTGPLGNSWEDFPLPWENRRRAALVGGGVGIAPLLSLGAVLPEGSFDFYAGFRALRNKREQKKLLGPVLHCGHETVIAVENADESGAAVRQGRITGFLDPRQYAMVYACGPEAMLKAVAASCKEAGTPCFVSLERPMACGVGACLGCTVRTRGGNRRCCTDGPIFNAEDLIFDD